MTSAAKRFAELKTTVSGLEEKKSSAAKICFAASEKLIDCSFMSLAWALRVLDMAVPSFTNAKSLLFGGSNEYVTMGNVLGFERTDPFSISLWCKPTISGTLVSKRNAGMSNTGYAIEYAYNLIYVYLECASGYIEIKSDMELNDGHWHHVVMTYDGSHDANGVDIYIDGTTDEPYQIYHNSLSSSIINDSDFQIGGTAGTTRCVSGYIDEVAVYDKQLSASEVADIYYAGDPRSLTDIGPTENLVGWWRSDDDTYPTIVDHSSGSHNGTLVNMEVGDLVDLVPSFETTKCIDFNGGDHYASMGNVLSYEYNQPFSAFCWMKSSDSGDFMLIAKRKNSGDYEGWALEQDGVNNQLVGQLRADTDHKLKIMGTTDLKNALSGWHLVGFTYDGSGSASGMKLYINGVLESSTVVEDTLGGNSIIHTGPLCLASREGTGQFYDGRLTEVSMWGKELSAAEVAEIYNSGKPANLYKHSATSDINGWWRLGNSLTYPTIHDGVAGNNGTLHNMSVATIISDAP